MSEEKTFSFMRSLCMGMIEEDAILPYPKMDEEEKETLKMMCSAIGEMLKPHEEDFRKWDREGEMPESFIQELREMGVFGFVIPEDFGGLGFKSAAYSRALQELAKYDASTAVTVGAHSSIGMRGLLLFGTKEQRERYYPQLATGEMIAAFCLTEPGAGSDAASIKTTAILDGDEWVLNGSKLWITNGGIADFFTVFAKTGDIETRGKMSAFLVTKDMPGVSISEHEDKMGLRSSSTTSVYFDDVRVPKDNLLGDLGKGFKIAMSILNSGRTGLGGGSVGMMKRLIELSTKQATERKQFEKSISEFGLIQSKVGNMVVKCYAAESVVNMVAGIIDQGHEDYAVEAAISKVFATEALWDVADEALQIAGGNGFMCEFPYERFVRDCRINRIFEGTNEILRLFIALTAMNDVGAELKELGKSLGDIMKHPIKGFGVLTDYALKKVSLATNLGRAKGSFSQLKPILGPYATIFENGVRDLASATDRILRKHGREIIHKQFATKRLANIMIDLFVLACVLSRVHTSIVDNGLAVAEKELEILQVFSRQAQGRIRRNFNLIDYNDDEQLKSLAKHAFDAQGYTWDSID